MSASNQAKRERKELARQRKAKERHRRRIFRIAVAAAVVLVVSGAAAYGVLRLTTRPGERVAEMGRNHVPYGTEIRYNSNPPTSGPHSDESTRAGIYDAPVHDTELIHSLEHGYVIISYDCERYDGPCGELAGRLADLARANRLWKLVVIPRPELDVPIALTAWTRIDKLDRFDERRIVRFIETWRDKGPERTAD